MAHFWTFEPGFLAKTRTGRGDVFWTDRKRTCVTPPGIFFAERLKLFVPMGLVVLVTSG